MAPNVLEQALACFLRAYTAQPELVAEQRGWSPVIEIGRASCRESV